VPVRSRLLAQALLTGALGSHPRAIETEVGLGLSPSLLVATKCENVPANVAS
jgi:hypothetical protein